jgi:hypothetical protein
MTAYPKAFPVHNDEAVFTYISSVFKQTFVKKKEIVPDFPLSLHANIDQTCEWSIWLERKKKGNCMEDTPYAKPSYNTE